MSSGPTQPGSVVGRHHGRRRLVAEQRGRAARVRRRPRRPDHDERPRPLEGRCPVGQLLGDGPDLGAGRAPRRAAGRPRPRRPARPGRAGRAGGPGHAGGSDASGPPRRLVQQQHRDAVPDREHPAALRAGQRCGVRIVRGRPTRSGAWCSAGQASTSSSTGSRPGPGRRRCPASCRVPSRPVRACAGRQERITARISSRSVRHRRRVRPPRRSAAAAARCCWTAR